MRTEKEVHGALKSHNANMARLEPDAALLQMMAHDLGWTVEFVKGYNKGVQWAYEWFLKKEKSR